MEKESEKLQRRLYLKKRFKLLGNAIGLMAIMLWLYIFLLALINHSYTVRFTISMNTFNEYWIELLLLIVGLIAFSYDIVTRIRKK